MRPQLRFREPPWRIVAIPALALALFASPGALVAGHPTGGAPDRPLSNATVFIIRHAEKPDDGPGLSPLGEQRALAYGRYFTNLTAGSGPVHLDYLVAAADSKKSQRPRLTIEPLGMAIGLQPDLAFKETDYMDLATTLKSEHRGKAILICWRHAEIPELLHALGANPDKLLPKGKWPDDEYSWVIQLRFDERGKLMPKKSKRLTPDFGR